MDFQKMQAGDPALLNLDQIFNSNEFVAQGLPSSKWLADGTDPMLVIRLYVWMRKRVIGKCNRILHCVQNDKRFNGSVNSP
jgi:hypothetical protein